MNEKPNYKILPLTKGMVSKVSKEDFDALNVRKWSFSVRGYAVARIDGKVVYMHRHILKLNDPVVKVDHKNGDKLDNTRENLRTCSDLQNRMNQGPGKKSKSGLKGVWMVPKNIHKTKRWCAMHRHKNLGYFYTPEEAAIAYNKAAREAFGEFAYQNKV